MSEIAFDENTVPLNEKLINARKQKNLTLEEVSRSLSLSVSQLTKLETEFSNLKNMTNFERGYIRNYAQFLELDIQHFESELSEHDRIGAELKSIKRFKYPTSQPFLKKGFGKLTLALFVLLFLIGLVAINL